RYNADEGLALGLSHYVVDDGAGMALAEELAAKIASNEPFTNFAIVNALPRIAEADPATGYLLEAAIGGASQSTASAKARIQEFLSRKPRPSSD
ncbi:MAG: enoyl-CoA hydratase, partial [Acidimicrobiia bacterium]